MVCPDWRDPLNVGSAFRLADAAGLSGIVLTGSTPIPPHTRIAKTARSTVRSVPWLQQASAVDFLNEQVIEGAIVLALEITDQSQSLFDFSLQDQTTGRGELPPVFLIAGNESVGISQEILDLCTASVHLPMFGQNTSMNVSVAMGAAVYLLLDKLK